MSAFEFDVQEAINYAEPQMYPSVAGGVILEGPDGAWIQCDQPAEVRK